MTVTRHCRLLFFGIGVSVGELLAYNVCVLVTQHCVPVCLFVVWFSNMLTGDWKCIEIKVCDYRKN